METVAYQSNVLLFNSHSNGAENCLSNFSPHPTFYGGLEYPTVEHAFQSLKFSGTDPDWGEAIRAARSPSVAKKMGSSRAHPIRARWPHVRSVVMHDLLQEKYTSNLAVRNALADTKGLVLVHHAPWDSYWGSGRDGLGLNMLGRIWMELRAEYC